MAPDARFECHRCGACCLRTQGVELLPGDRERIERHDWAGEGGRLAKGFLEPRFPNQEATTPERLRAQDGRCIFLDPDNLCRIEKRLGHAAKPARCRAFPLRFASTPRGIHVSVSPECQSQHRVYADGPPVEVTDELRELARQMPRLLVIGKAFVFREGEPPRLGWDDVYAVLEDAAAQVIPPRSSEREAGPRGGAAADDEPLHALPLALQRAVRRAGGGALGGAIPKTPWKHEGPPDVPFYQCLDYLGKEVGPIARQQGLGRMAGAFAELRRYQAWRRAAVELDAAAAGAPGKFLRHVLRALILELRPVQLGQVVAGLGSALYLALATGVAAVKRAEVERRGAKVDAADVNLAADEAAQLYRLRPFVDALIPCSLALERLVYDAPPAA
jgi:Fe-S-cluster containining protein